MKPSLFFAGGKGFLGKNFIEQCDNCYHIEAPNRSQLDLTNEKLVDCYFAAKTFDCIINAASDGVTRKSQLAPLVALNSNLRSFTNIYKNRYSTKRFIQIGSGAEYSRPILSSQISEEYLGTSIPKDEYGYAKFISSRLLANEPPEKAVTLHLFGVFGPYEDYQVRFVSNAIVRTLFNLPIIINQNIEFDYIYVNDCIKIIREFITRPASYANYNITTGEPLLLSDIAEIVRDILNTKQNVIVKNTIVDSFYSGSNQRLRNFLGSHFKFTPIRIAIKELAEWYSLHLHTLNKDWIFNPL